MNMTVINTYALDALFEGILDKGVPNVGSMAGNVNGVPSKVRGGGRTATFNILRRCTVVRGYKQPNVMRCKKFFGNTFQLHTKLLRHFVIIVKPSYHIKKICNIIDTHNIDLILNALHVVSF